MKQSGIGTILILGTMIMTSVSHASGPSSRTLGQLGTSVGSLHYKDNRNIFYIPASLRRFGSFLTFEETEGGIFRSKKKDKVSYCIYYGQDDSQWGNPFFS